MLNNKNNLFQNLAQSFMYSLVYGLGVLTLGVYSTIAFGSSAEVQLDKVNIDSSDYASLQRGAKYFTNFCGGCHSAEYMRYSRMAKDIKITDANTSDGEVYTDLVKTNLMFNTADINSHMKSGLTKKDGDKMFGVAPPDLTMVTRVRGNDWVYTYLKGFYADSNRPWGVNNKVFKDVAMPHILSNYQGKQELVGGELVITEPGIYNDEQYDQMVTDITNFLAYTAEPYKSDRISTGVWVLLFLSILLVFAYLMKREYWRDIKK